ncbi:MAG: ATP-binding protein [Bacteroidota bacterium]|nr:ATP-binding protein [Bacteroidota bacterium]
MKVGDGLLYTAEDIAPRKLLEQAQTKSFALLQQSEAVAAMGSWEYDLGAQELTWSEGLYRLFGQSVGSPVHLQSFLDAVLDDDRPAAARLLRTLTAGSGRFDASLRLRVGDAVKTVRFKAVPIPDAPGMPERVLGVCLDVSDVQRLEAENLALKLDRHKELLLGILQAQETERQRLAEVLHNGLGQVLYATKLHLDQLNTPALRALPALAGLHQQTDRLLADAMRQTRTLAHELVPTSLVEFGLVAAVRDVCRDLSTPQLRIACHVWGEELPLPQPVQVTLFRLVQELTHNIVRHAGATEATLELETLPGGVSLRAEDNGRGFDPLTVAEGLGLRTVRQAVALLGGTVAVDSSPEFGTHIRLRIPLPLFS